MEWLVENWFLVLVGIAFIGMHLFGRGCHSGHNNHGGKEATNKMSTGSDRPSGHQH